MPSNTQIHFSGDRGWARTSGAIALPCLVAVLLITGIAPNASAEDSTTSVPADGSAASRPAGSPAAASDAFKLPIFTNNALAYIYGPSYRSPSITSVSKPGGADIARNALEFAHVDSWKYGHNLVEIIVRNSDSVEPAAGGGSGAMEFYSVFRSGLGINRIAGRPIIRFGVLRDIDIQAGADLQTKNTAFAPSERTLYLGPRFLFVFPSGFVNIGVHFRKEWNHNGILGTNENYDAGLNIEPAWSFPFHVGQTRITFDGFADYNSSKGRDSFGQRTRAEFIVRPQLKIDVGHGFGLMPRVLELGFGVEHWHNMFGKDARTVPGANQTTPVVSLVVHWGGHRAAETDARSELR
jgi:hypothetical protein